jgi:glyoxylase-like metal-dependent hydrolase (beta-lactamase superfamily II)
MNPPTVNSRRNVAADVDQLGTYIPVPGIGHFAVNAFLLRSREPVLVDAGIVTMQEPMLSALEALIDPSELRWLYLTHVDSDHVGCVETLLRRAPKARIVTTFLGWSKLGFGRSIAPDRFLLLNPGEELDVGDRKLLVTRPPCYDAPETTMLFDPTSRTLFSSDYFGALVPSPVEVAEQVPANALREGMMAWLSVDSPWVRMLQPALLEQATRGVLELAPETVLSTHLAPARRMADVLSANVLAAPGAAPFVGPDQAAFEKMLEAMG